MEGQPPDRIETGQRCRLQRRGEGRVISIIRRKVRPNRHPRRAGQRRHRDHKVGILFAGQGQRIGQNQPPFGVGVVHLNRQPLAAGQDVLWFQGIARNHILNRRDQDPQPQGQVQGHDHLRQTQDRGRAAHILLHQVHAGRGFKVQPPGVKADPFADQRQRRSIGAPAQVKKARRARAGATDRVDHREVLRHKIVAPDGPGLGAMARGQRHDGRLKLIRTHVLRGGVDQIAGQSLSLGHGDQPGGIQSFRAGQPWQNGRFAVRAITVKAVACQQPAKGGLGHLSLVQVSRQRPVPRGQARHDFGQPKA